MFEGEQITIPAGEIVRAGHPLLKGREEHFEPVESFGRFDVEQATAAPGEKRELKGRQWRAAREAWRNACTERPPERWSTGVHIYGLDR
jgi:hypothetical protein